jgi:hypothetical protein
MGRRWIWGSNWGSKLGWTLRSILAVLLLLGFMASARGGAAPIRVAILDGQSAGAYHNWQVTTSVLKRELE